MRFQMFCIMLHQQGIKLYQFLYQWLHDRGLIVHRFWPSPATKTDCLIGVSTRGPDWLRVERMYLAYSERSQPNVVYSLRLFYRLKLSVSVIRDLKVNPLTDQPT